MFTELEKKVISLIQGDIPITDRPYLELAKQADMSEEIFIETLKDLSNRGIIRRFGATLKHQKSGFVSNAMVAWQVDEKCVDEVGAMMASFQPVSHCYRRNPVDEWPYNVYTMIHAGDEKECHEIACQISKATSINNYTLLFSQRELKKTSMQYFAFDDED